MRGDASSTESANLALEATFETVELDLLITEMEDAGFELDVEEGFDEEWEEEFWVGSDADDVEALIIDPDEANLMDAEESVQPEDLQEDWDAIAWEDPEAVLEASEEFAERGERDVIDADLLEDIDEMEDVEFAMVTDFEEVPAWDEEEAWWDNENGYDDSWDELLEEWEMENLESEYELEDLDMLEMMYEVQ